MSIVSGSPPSAPASMGGLSSAVEDVSTGMSSLRFDGSSQLIKTNQVGSTDWTWSLWFKNSSLSGARRFLRLCYSPYFYISMNSEGAAADVGKIAGGGSTPSVVGFKTSQVFRDTNAWYHLLSNKTGIFINGERIVTFTSNLSMVGDGSTGNNGKWYIGQNGANNNAFFMGYMAGIYYIESNSLDPSSFGELVSDVWRPKKYSGDYGVNGFHLDFHPDNMVYDVNGQLATVMDASGNDNHWTAH